MSMSMNRMIFIFLRRPNMIRMVKHDVVRLTRQKDLLLLLVIWSPELRLLRLLRLPHLPQWMVLQARKDNKDQDAVAASISA